MPTEQATAAFRRAMGRSPQRIPYGRMQVTEAKPLDAGALYHYWHPDREGAIPCPAHFATELKNFHKDLAICQPPAGAPTVSHPWLVWYRKEAVTHWLSPGWLLLFVWQTPPPELKPLPLDNRIFANLYSISSMAFGSGAAYFESVVKTLESDRARIAAKDKASTDAQKREYMQFRKIKNIGRGNKFALHHDGGVVPSKGEAAWTADTDLARMPAKTAARVRDAKKRIDSARKGRR